MPVRVELDELHVLQRQAGAQHHRVAVAGAGMRGGRREVGATVTAGGEDDHLGAKAVDRAVIELEADHADAAAVLVHDEVDREELDEELGVVLESLAVERMKHGVAGPVGRSAGTLSRRSLAEIRRHAAERPLVDLAFLCARERHAPVLKLVDRLRRVLAKVFDGILVAQPVRPLHGVVHVPLPIVVAHVAERGGDAPLSRYRVRTRREHLGDAGGTQTGLRAADRGPQARPAGAHHHDIERVVGNRIGCAALTGSRRTVGRAVEGHGCAFRGQGRSGRAQPAKLTLSREYTQATAAATEKNVFAISDQSFK